MSVSIQVHVLIDPSLVADADRLAELLGKIRDFSPVLETAGGLLEEGIREWFTSQGEGTWAELSPATVRDRFRRGYGPNNPLVRSGDLLAALTEEGAPGHKFLVSETGVSVGAYSGALVYMDRLASGDPAHRLPARMLVSVPAGQIDRIIDLISEWLGGGPGVRVWADPPVPVID